VLCSLVDNMPYVVAEAAVRPRARRTPALQRPPRPGPDPPARTQVGVVPFVVYDIDARAQVKGIPFVMFDIGGVVEMVDYKLHGDVVIPEPSMPALRDKLTGERPRALRCPEQRGGPHVTGPAGLTGAGACAQTCCTRARSRRCS